MQLIRGLQNLDKNNGSVVTIGNFDGVHIGHQKIIAELVKKSKELKLPSTLISFMPTPQCFFGHDQATLSNFKEKHLLLEQLYLDKHLLIRFNQHFSQIEAQAFIQEILLDRLNMKHCIIGDDFRFGKNRKGDFKLLQDLSKKNNFSVDSTQSILCDKYRISSSKIRELLSDGEITLANKMLGREFSISGKIIHGEKKGRSINFPTINIPIRRTISPVLGVFAVEVLLDGRSHQGVCNIGSRPTVDDKKTLLEVFIFDFSADVYGQCAKVFFKHKIRDEQKFDSFNALKQQIEKDTQTAKSFFNLPSSAVSDLP